MHIKTADGIEGDLVFELWEDVAPKTVANFKALATSGFYDGTAFHRVAKFVKKGILIGGDPNTKEESTCTAADKGKECFQGLGYGPDGFITYPRRQSMDDIRKTRELWDKGGPPGWRRDSRSQFKLEPEFSTRTHERGVITMRRFNRPDSAGSQFIICVTDMSKELDGNYAAFGKLVKGEELLDQILKTEVGKSGALEFFRDDGKQGVVWPAYDQPVYRQGIESIRID
jgi:peptidyl-prolyl cis-trans isomerase B (cyclophilin B)